MERPLEGIKVDRNSHQMCNVKIELLLKTLQNSQEHTYDRASFLMITLPATACNFIKKQTLAQMFSREFCEISKNTFFTKYLQATASYIYLPVIILIYFV